MPIYTLYVKTHNITGFKYLGYTKQNTSKYKGSRNIWLLHLKNYGNNFSTQIIVQNENTALISFWGRYFSEEWNIVESEEWANLIPETCGGGRVLNSPPQLCSEETRKKISKTLTGRKHALEHRKINSLSKL